MFPAPHYREQLSLMLSEVLEDIGVNEQMVMRRTKLMKMLETMSTVTMRSTGTDMTSYILGSQSEGSTTIGLNSDIDFVGCDDNVNVIQNLSEWEHGKQNYLMIQNENTTPGYCFLQLLRHDEPLPVTERPDDHHILEKRKILSKNTIKNDNLFSDNEQHGPSIATLGQYVFCDKDNVLAYPCKSWPQSASNWLEKKGTGKWPNQEMKRYAVNTRCLVVPTGSKVSVHPELEWRISTSLAERCLMLYLNITQIRCYVLMKMILKSFLNPLGKINISSYMCKTVLLNCVENTEHSIWKEDNLLTCLIFSLQKLYCCVQNEYCSHFIISENNLMAGQFSSETKQKLLENISDFIQNDGRSFIGIDIDDLGYRLQVKLNMVPQKVYGFHYSLQTFALVYINFAFILNGIHQHFSKELQNENIEKINQSVAKLLFQMTYDIGNGERLQHTIFKFLAPLTFTTYGSALASSSFGANNQVLPEALDWLSAGLTSDVTSGRLKMASVFYSIGEMEKAEEILRRTEQLYNSHPVLSICSRLLRSPPTVSEDFAKVCIEHNEDCIKHIVAFCVHFIPQEINCVPHELQYEMFRSTQDDMLYRDPEYDCWMDWATVDSLPFLYFLQYKIYSHLQRQQEKQQALDNLIRTIVTEENISHIETALNILGQCMEQENRPQNALECYIRSLHQRARNNVANIHICLLLSRLLVAK